MILWFLLLIFSSRSSSELITTLPGQPANVSFKQYSGYIVTDAQHGRAIFYYFVEAESANPLSRPLTLWLNGGPGCSSLGFGAFMEHGPFQPGSDGSLIKNKYSWNLESNMLYVETPIGVGFSYSNTSLDYVNWNDSRTAQENLQFIINWFKEFPEFGESSLYLTGESYAGHYIPQLVALLLEYNKQPSIKPVKLKAIALGNPLLDIEISVQDADYLWSHGVISDEMLILKKAVCNDSRYILERINHNLSKACAEVFKELGDEVGSYTDMGDLLMPICQSPSAIEQSISYRFHADLHAKFAKRTAVGDPCLSEKIYMYLNKPQLQEALHANTTLLPYAWDFCSGPLSYQKDNIAINTIPLLREILRAHIPILFYSGDQDAKVPLTQTRIIANMLAKDMKLLAMGKYAPWYDNLQVGGWSQSFGQLMKGKNITYLTFATVKGAAHEVPFTSPSQALTLFRSFLRGSPLPRISMT